MSRFRQDKKNILTALKIKLCSEDVFQNTLNLKIVLFKINENCYSENCNKRILKKC